MDLLLHSGLAVEVMLPCHDGDLRFGLGLHDRW
jgi:hypothetical protein